MNSKRLSLLCVLGGWLVFSPVFAATEYVVFFSKPDELQQRLNQGVKDGWKLKSVNSLPAGTGGRVEVMVVLERN